MIEQQRNDSELAEALGACADGLNACADRFAELERRVARLEAGKAATKTKPMRPKFAEYPRRGPNGVTTP